MKNTVTQNTDFINIPIDQIIISDTNPRTVFEKDKICELSESIKRAGLIQPITVRLPHTEQNGKKFLLVCGARRLTASVLAGLTEIPSYFRNLSDAEAEDLQIIENLHREDVHPLDESEAFLKMTGNKIPIDQIALKIGKTVLFIKERLALNGLIKEAKEDFRKGIMKLGHAKILCLLLAEQQKSVMNQLAYKDDQDKYYNNPRELKNFVNQRVLLRLADAPFDTGSKFLVKKAGACTDCPTQTGANQELFNCVTSESKCQNGACWELKVKAAIGLHNKALLDKHGFNRNTCVPITHEYYNYNDRNALTRSDYQAVAEFNECATVTLGFDKQSDQVLKICANKKCLTHFKPETHISEGREVKSRSGIPLDESLSEGLKRKMIKRHAKEDKLDRNTAREQLADKMLSIESESLNNYEIDKVISIVIWNMIGSNALKTVTELIGYDKELNCFDIEKLLKFISAFSEKEKYMCLRKMLVLKALSNDIGEHDFYKSSDFMLHAKSLKKSITPIYNKLKKNRDNTRAENIKNVKAQIKKSQDKENKYLTFYLSHTSEFLKKVKNLSIDQLTKQPLEKLKDLVKELGCKRPKDADTRYYAHTLFERMAYLKKKSKEAKQISKTRAANRKAA